jgi:DNA-directed RNA polymerase subunit RPC12/RpoP
MPIPVTCACGKQYTLKDEFAGKRAKCPACGGVIAVPAQRTGEPARLQRVSEPSPAPTKRSQMACTITYQCPGCGADLENPTTLVGQQDTCPECGSRHTVPKGSARLPRRWILVSAVGGAAIAATIVFLVWPRNKTPDTATPTTQSTTVLTRSASTDTPPNAQVQPSAHVPAAAPETAPSSSPAQHGDAVVISNPDRVEFSVMVRSLASPDAAGMLDRMRNKFASIVNDKPPTLMLMAIRWSPKTGAEIAPGGSGAWLSGKGIVPSQIASLGVTETRYVALTFDMGDVLARYDLEGKLIGA